MTPGGEYMHYTKPFFLYPIASELAGGTLTALGTVYSALENSSRILATNVANNTVQVLSHK